MNGYFQLQRRLFDHWLWKDERVFSRVEAFLDLLQLAAFTHSKRIVSGTLITLNPGQLCASERYLSGRWKWSTTKVRAYLTLLEADKMVEKEKKQGVTVVTLTNYEKYARGEPDKKAQNNQRESSEKAVRKRIEEGEQGQQGGEEASAPPPAVGRIISELANLFPHAARSMTRTDINELRASMSLLEEFTPDDWLACKAWMKAPQRIRGRALWPRNRAEFVANAGEAIEKIRDWWSREGRKWWSPQQRPQGKASEKEPEGTPLTDEEMEAILKQFKI